MRPLVYCMLYNRRQIPIVHQEVIQMKNKKLLTFVSAALIAATAVAPTVMSVSAAGTNTNYVRFATPTLDGELDNAYKKSFSFKLSDLVSSGKLDMNTFQLQQMQFYDVYDASEDDPYIMIFDANKKEITKAEFDDKYESDFQLLPEGCTFRWTNAGIKSPFFKEAEFYFLYNGENIYVYADVTDNAIYSLSEKELLEDYSSGWSGRPWLSDSVSATFYLDELANKHYKIDDATGNVVEDPNQSTAYSELSVNASADGKIYYSKTSGEEYFDTEKAAFTNIGALTSLSDYNINWWEYCCFEDSNKRAEEFRSHNCDDSDKTPVVNSETGKQRYCYYGEDGKRYVVDDPSKAPAEYQDKCELAFDICSKDFHTYLSRHIFNAEKLAARDAGRAANLEHVKAKATDKGYAVEMEIPLTEGAKAYIESGKSVSFSSNVCNADAGRGGTPTFAGGNATNWYLIAMPAQQFPITFTKADFASALTAGDVNGDGVIDTKDLIRLMKSVSGQSIAIFNADLNGDDEISTKDLIRLMKKIAGAEVELVAKDLV